MSGSIGRFLSFGIISAAALAFAAPAFACSILPPPPPPEAPAGTPQADVEALERAWNEAHGRKYAEETRDWALKQQARLFDEAGSLVLARYDREEKTRGMPKQFSYMNGLPLAVLKPIRWLKGDGGSAEINIGSTQPPPCGQMTGHDAVYGKPGDVFLVYLAEDKSLMQAYSLERIIEPRTIAALTKGPE